MKITASCIAIVLLMGLFILEIIQLKKLSSLNNPIEDSIMPMLYENQVYQSAATDGLLITSSVFLSEMHSREVFQPVLVLRYSGLSCKGCVQSCLNALRRHCPGFEANPRVLIVASETTSFRGVSDCLILPEGNRLGYDLEDTYIPHFFVYLPDCQSIIHTFIPDQSDANALNIYLASILGRYGI